jgi:hypothetical protein
MFQIDTGRTQNHFRVDKCEAIRFAAADRLPHGDQAELDAETGRLILADLLSAKRAATSRAHLLQLWPLLAEMADRSPATFDHVILEFAEHLAAFR